MDPIIQTLAAELAETETHVEAVVRLLDEGNTIPFIARYRKELHGAMDDTSLRTLEERLGYLRNLQERKDFESSDNEFCYLLHIEAFEPEGSTQPFELAKTEIAEMLGNYRQVELISQVKKDLYEHGVETGRVKLKNNKENEE